MEIFPAGKPVIGKDLIGREKELKKFFELLKSGQSIIISAPRRYGKTSILLELERRLRLEKHYTAYIDIFSCSNKYELATAIIEKTLENKKIKNFVRKVKENLKDLIDRLKITGTYNDIEYALKIDRKDIDVNKLLKESLSLPEKIARRDKKIFYIFFDEFGDIAKYDGSEILKFIRAIVQKQQNVCYIFSGSQKSIIKEIFLSKSQPFFQFALFFEIGKINVDVFKRYLLEKFKILKIKLEEEIIDSILSITQGHPFYTMLMAKMLYLRKVSGLRITIDDLIEDTINVERPYFDDLWDRLSERKNYREVIKYLVFENQKGMFTDERLRSLNLSRILRDLQKMGIIEKRENVYRFIDPLFYEYLRRG